VTADATLGHDVDAGSEPALAGDPDHTGAPAPRRRRAVAAVAVAALVAVTAAVTLAVTGGGHPEPAGAAPLDLATVSTDIAGHYRHAAAHTDAYGQIPCWCGCEQFLGHRNLADCFVRPDGRGFEAHAAGCGVCNGEATIAERMLAAGSTPAEVAAAVTTEFGTTAITAPPTR
jgi:hypothetical protein